MALRMIVLVVVLLMLAAIGYFIGMGEALACGMAAVGVYIYFMVRRFRAVQAARLPSRPEAPDGDGGEPRP